MYLDVPLHLVGVRPGAWLRVDHPRHGSDAARHRDGSAHASDGADAARVGLRGVGRVGREASR